MKTKNIICKLFCLLLALGMLVTLASCTGSSEPGGETAATEAGNTQDEVDAIYKKTGLEPRDWEAEEEEEFFIRYATDTTFVPTPINVNSAEAQKGIVAKAGYSRDQLFEDLLNVSIVYVRSDTNPNSIGSGKDETAALRALVSGGDVKDIDLVLTGSRAAGVMVAEQFYTDLAQYDQYVHPSNSYYPAAFNEQLCIGDKQLLATGYYTTFNLSAVNVMVVNKAILNSTYDVHGYTLEDLYELTNEKKWTMELMLQIGGTYASLNNSGNADSEHYSALFGFNSLLSAYFAMGADCIVKDSEGVPQVGLDTSDVDLIDWFRLNITNSQNVYIAPNDSERDTFRKGTTMFGMNLFATVPDFRTWDMDVSYLPMPLYGDGDSYRSPIEAWCLNVAGIPAGVENAEFAAYCYEMFMAMSHEYIYPAFYETVAGKMWVKDEAEAKVYDMISGNLYVDLAGAYKWHHSKSDTNLRDLLGNSKATEIASTVSATKGILDASIKDFLQKYQ